MTTIAYKDGIIAYDSRMTCGSTVFSDNGEKKAEDGSGLVIVFSGPSFLIDEMISIWNGAETNCSDFNAIAFSEGCFYLVCPGENGTITKTRIPEGDHFAIGSGSDHAITAMDMGASAKEAVKIAAKRDVYTGGKIKTWGAS